MAQQYDNELSGMLAKNTYKTEDKHPTYTGVIQIDGKKYKLAAWPRERKDGEKYLSLKATPAEEQGQAGRSSRPATSRRQSDELEF